MPITNHTITVTVNGVDKTTSLLKDSLFIRLQQKNKSTCELKFKNYDPPERATTIVSVNGTAVFGGYIVRKSASIQGVKNASSVTWNCELRDWSELLETVKASGQYVSQSDFLIIDSVFSIYLPDIFDTTTFITPQESSLDFSFTDLSIAEFLDTLAKRVGASWFIKPDKSLVWFNKQTGFAADFGISSSPNNSTTFGFLNNSLSYEVDSSTIVNQVKIIAGVTSNGEKIYESWTGDGTTKVFPLSQIPNAISYCAFNDGLGNYNVYGSFVGLAPQDKLRSQGGNYTAVVDPIAKTLTVEGPSGKAPMNLSTIDAQYYKKELVYSTFDDLTSQATFGIYPITIQDKQFQSVEAAEELADAILEQNAFGRTSIKFETTKYGLLPGQLVLIDVAELEVAAGWVDNVLAEEDLDNLTLENGDFILLESYALGRTFIVQEVSLQPVLTATNEYMLVCQVQAGKYVPNLVDALSSLSELKSSLGNNALNAIPNKLSNISSDMGEIQVGRAVFTDGGTARFNWGTPNSASGIVVGLDDRNDWQGALYVYDAGQVKVKIGKLDEIGTVFGTVVAEDWGIYTNNGYFKGVVAASQLIGGTVTGSLITGNTVTGGTLTGAYISGGTVTGGTIFGPSIVGGTIEGNTVYASSFIGNTLTANTISSGTITGNSINGGTITGTRITGGSIVGNTIIGGTIATGTPPINSSNPGVYIDSTGLYGYDNLGLTFRLATDPAIKPFISSGTVTEVKFEVSTNSVIRTGTTNPRVQIDNSGIYAYDSIGALNFSVDSATGLLSAVNGTFQGAVESSNIFSSYMVSGTVDAGTITSCAINSGTITGNQIVGGTITGGKINGGTITAGLFTGGTVTAGTITGNLISGGTVSGGVVTGGTVTGSQMTGGTITGGYISGGTINAGYFNSGNLNNGTISAAQITGGTITSTVFTGHTFSGEQITGGTVSGSYISGGTVNGAVITVNSGSVTLTTNGLRLIGKSSFTNADPSNIQWLTAGSVIGQATTYYNASEASYQVKVGQLSAIDGRYSSFVYDNTGKFSQFSQKANTFNFEAESAITLMTLTTTALTAYKNVIPSETSSNLQLGDSSHAFRYLYLKDDGGVTRRISINLLGVLTVT
jgi:hypothetical protein